jgi:hypothetical protein|tara:strand:+ start:404 stop:595 length:192 start_codon:yes stop_codon:yes gene_type:complete
MVGFIMIGCLMAHHSKKVGVIDIIDNGACSIQLEDSTMILVSSSVCKGLREGDTIEVKHDKSR